MKQLQYSDNFVFREYDYAIHCQVTAERPFLKVFKTKSTYSVRIARQGKQPRYLPKSKWILVKKEDEVDPKSNRVLNTAYNQWHLAKNQQEATLSGCSF